MEYRTIEARYMERDNLFPTKDEVVAHYYRFGWRGFTKDFVRHLDTLRKAVQNIKQCYPCTDFFDGMLDIALTPPDTAKICW